MEDREVLDSIEKLVEEEHRLLEQAGSGALEGDAHARLRSVQVRLDQCWDLLRQRRGRRHADDDPDRAKVRDPYTVEHYQQ
jgi:hypothetical protein